MTFHLTALRQGLSMNQKLALSNRLLGKWAFRMHLFLPHPVLDIRHMATCIAFSMESEDSKSGPCAYRGQGLRVKYVIQSHLDYSTLHLLQLPDNLKLFIWHTFCHKLCFHWRTLLNSLSIRNERWVEVLMNNVRQLSFCMSRSLNDQVSEFLWIAVHTA